MTTRITRPLRAMAAALAVATLWSMPTHAAKNDILLSFIAGQQPQFDQFVEEAGYAIAYNPLAPAEPEGIIGFQVGAAVTMVKIDKAVWAPALAGNPPGALPVPRLMIRKGLPFGIDLGLSQIKVPSSNISVTGGEIRKSLLGGNMAMPAVSVALSGAKLSGVKELDLSTYGLGVGVSKGFLMFTPYAGLDQIWIKGKEKAGIGFADAKESVTRGHIGLKFAFLPIANLTLQGDAPLSGGSTSYSLRLNVGL
ncbi:MAG: hypothetical protein OEW11_05380 [Nitrospirota bacterium]|nr:hypothetical protein [Nitrospirota bacterium]